MSVDNYPGAYNAHERAEEAALVAMSEMLAEQSSEALACLCDPEWNWITRSHWSESIIEMANEVLNHRLNQAVGVNA